MSPTQSFEEFVLQDETPITNRLKLEELQNEPKKQRKKDDNFGSKFSNFFKLKRPKQRTSLPRLQYVRLTILDNREDLALKYLDEIQTLSHVSGPLLLSTFLMAFLRRMEKVCIQMFLKGFPFCANDSFYGNYPSFLMLSIFFGMLELTQLMLKDADLEKRCFGFTPLILACAVGSIPLVQMLLDHGASCDSGIPVQMYMLLCKFKVKNPQILPYKQQYGQNLDDVGDYYLYPLDIAAMRRNKRLVDVLLKYDQSKNQMSLLVQQDFGITVSLCRGSVNKDQRDWRGAGPMHIAARLGWFDAVFLFIRLNMDVNQLGQNNWTPLHEAVSQSNRAVCRLLIRNGALKTIPNIDGKTPLDFAKIFNIETDFFCDTPTEEEVQREKEVLSAVPHHERKK